MNKTNTYSYVRQHLTKTRKIHIIVLCNLFNLTIIDGMELAGLDFLGLN